MKLIEVWKASKEIPVCDLMTALLGKRMSKMKGFELTGIPPLTFQGTAGFLQNYRIFGNEGGVGEPTEEDAPSDYQISVSVHGANLYNSAVNVYGYLSETGDILQQTINNYMTSDFIRTNGTEVELSFVTSSYTSERGIIICAYDAEKNFISAPLYESFNSSGRNVRISRTVSVPENTKYVRFSYLIRNSYTFSADTEIELTEHSEVSVYIGSEPLNSGEYVSFSEQKIYRKVNDILTPTEPPVPLPNISTLDGQNVLTVETTIQPSQMYIRGKMKN